ncbi:hypothetical protein BofuT4_uP023340.1 [Botrytis cinerea T4]|uniref:Uncharacterized protein n=1 Tax=Botryotinia fuckeliana (strain T4) TaxID=999810 RepID=G2YH32_BOTF4|nr:hypothetical protein BofuT4_uP023340.1 [Botrytis cinerea T4]
MAPSPRTFLLDLMLLATSALENNPQLKLLYLARAKLHVIQDGLM